MSAVHTSVPLAALLPFAERRLVLEAASAR
jgi:hypothetical protein